MQIFNKKLMDKWWVHSLRFKSESKTNSSFQVITILYFCSNKIHFLLEQLDLLVQSQQQKH